MLTLNAGTKTLALSRSSGGCSDDKKCAVQATFVPANGLAATQPAHFCDGHISPKMFRGTFAGMRNRVILGARGAFLKRRQEQA